MGWNYYGWDNDRIYHFNSSYTNAQHFWDNFDFYNQGSNSNYPSDYDPDIIDLEEGQYKITNIED